MDVKLSVFGPTNGCAQKMVDGRSRVYSSVALVDLAVWSFGVRNLCKYGLGSLRKTPTEFHWSWSLVKTIDHNSNNQPDFAFVLSVENKNCDGLSTDHPWGLGDNISSLIAHLRSSQCNVKPAQTN